MYLRSVKRARADPACEKSCISREKSHSVVSVVSGAACSGAAARARLTSSRHHARRVNHGRKRLDGAWGIRVPVIVKVEPVIRRKPAIVLEAVDVFLGPEYHILCAILPADLYTFGQELEINVITIAAAIQAEAQNNRYLKRVGQQHGTTWENRFFAKECRADLSVVKHHAVAQYPHQRPAIDLFLDLQQGIRRPDGNDTVRHGGVYRIKNGINLFRVFLVHQHLDRQVLLQNTRCAHRVKAAQMRTQEQATLATFHLPLDNFGAMHLYLKEIMSTAQEINAVQQRGGKILIVTKHIEPIDRLRANALQVVETGTAARAREQNKIDRDRIQQNSAQATTESRSNPRDQTQSQVTSALGLTQPGTTHHFLPTLMARYRQLDTACRDHRLFHAAFEPQRVWRYRQQGYQNFLFGAHGRQKFDGWHSYHPYLTFVELFGDIYHMGKKDDTGHQRISREVSRQRWMRSVYVNNLIHPVRSPWRAASDFQTKSSLLCQARWRWR